MLDECQGVRTNVHDGRMVFGSDRGGAEDARVQIRRENEILFRLFLIQCESKGKEVDVRNDNTVFVNCNAVFVFVRICHHGVVTVDKGESQIFQQSDKGRS